MRMERHQHVGDHQVERGELGAVAQMPGGSLLGDLADDCDAGKLSVSASKLRPGRTRSRKRSTAWALI